MLKKRIIPCLDIHNGRTVKGVNFLDLVDAGDAVELARRYSQEGADELVFLDISATIERRKTLVPLVYRIAREINIPFTVGGGIGSVDDVAQLMDAGADKVAVNSAMVEKPELIGAIAHRFGSQCIVAAIDTRRIEHSSRVVVHGGRTITDHNTVQWAKTIAELGAGEILLTSMHADGTRNGFDVEITAEVSDQVGVPVIASGGAGSMQHFAEIFTSSQASAALAASVFHFSQISIPGLKKFLKHKKIPVRCN